MSEDEDIVFEVSYIWWYSVFFYYVGILLEIGH